MSIYHLSFLSLTRQSADFTVLSKCLSHLTNKQEFKIRRAHDTSKQIVPMFHESSPADSFAAQLETMATQWNVYENFQALLQAGPYHLALEGVLLLWILWLLTAKKQPSTKNQRLSRKEEEDLLAEWTPEPLVPNPPDPNHPDLKPRVVQGKLGLHVDLGSGRELVNVASHSYLNLNARDEIEKEVLECLHRYGVGSCGPRGFYGTTQVHLELEEKLAKFLNFEMGVLYSYGFSTIASAIPAYSKSGDLIFADERVNFAVQRGLQASRSKVIYFRHNDMKHLEELLEEQDKLDNKDPKKACATRRYLVVEGVYINTGKICPLPQLVELRQKHKLRLFIDESISFGTLGTNGKGVLDHFNIPVEEVDMIMASLEFALATTGGFCVGTNFVIEHQRLSGLGYCFSASLPPMLAAAAIKALDIIEDEGPRLVVDLQEKCKAMHEALESHLAPSKVEVVGDPITPVKHVVLKEPLGNHEEECDLFRKAVKKAEEEGVAVVSSSYLVDKEAFNHPPSLRITVNKDLTQEEIEIVAKVLGSIFSISTA
ncbi:serine palmitoyltransferase subunit I [Oratosquilla oratoria]|uniref:serine palmitoyltransferase subunit I n=1 Tax=Oratosquilla oratoria TaxID=337810 RepID=UPI003F75E444